MSISHRQSGAWCSLFVVGTVEPRANHHFLTPEPIAVTKFGHSLAINILCGTTDFHDADGLPVDPVGYISKTEFFALRSMLGGVDDDGNVTERTLPLAWEEIDAMVQAMRQPDETINQESL